jgi:triosephosphate isomerase
MRKKIIAGNWKMNVGLHEGIELADSINKCLINNPHDDITVVLCVPFTHLTSISEVIKTGKIYVGAQNCASEISGSYTGEVSADMVKSAGAEYVIVGHSERRTHHREHDSLINEKVFCALDSGLKVIFCCGEILTERAENKHLVVVKKQVERGLFYLSNEQISNIIIAYEPVWAVGSDISATAGQAQEMHSFIRNLIVEKYGVATANNLSILYGGSCNPSNAGKIFSKPDVDGGLVGRASLKTEDFIGVIEAL